MTAKALTGLGGALVALSLLWGDVSVAADVAAPATEGQDPTSGVRNRIWIRQFGTRFFDSANAVAVDASGNIMVAGQTEGSLAEPRQGFGSAFIAKYSPAGNRLWVRQLGTSVGAAANAVATDAEGNVLVAGDAFGSLAGPYQGDYDGFVAKYDPAGTLVWVRQFGTTEYDHPQGVATDALGNVVVSGFTAGVLGDGNRGKSDVFVAKYTAAGDLLWIGQFGTAESDWAKGGAIDGDGNILIGGTTFGSLAGPLQGRSDAFVAKMSAVGTLLWSRQLGSIESEGWQEWGVATDAEGDVVICGWIWPELFRNRPIAAFVAKYNADGTLRWVRKFAPGAKLHEANGVVIDPDGNVVISGDTAGPGNQDAFIAKFDPAGTLIWRRQPAGTEFDGSWGVASDAGGNVVIVGYTNGSLRGPNRGDFDAFVAKYRP